MTPIFISCTDHTWLQFYRDFTLSRSPTISSLKITDHSFSCITSPLELTSRFISSPSPVLSRFTCSFTCQTHPCHHRHHSHHPLLLQSVKRRGPRAVSANRAGVWRKGEVGHLPRKNHFVPKMTSLCTF